MKGRLCAKDCSSPWTHRWNWTHTWLLPHRVSHNLGLPEHTCPLCFSHTEQVSWSLGCGGTSHPPFHSDELQGSETTCSKILTTTASPTHASSFSMFSPKQLENNGTVYKSKAKNQLTFSFKLSAAVSVKPPFIRHPASVPQCKYVEKPLVIFSFHVCGPGLPWVGFFFIFTLFQMFSITCSPSGFFPSIRGPAYEICFFFSTAKPLRQQGLLISLSCPHHALVVSLDPMNHRLCLCFGTGGRDHQYSAAGIFWGLLDPSSILHSGTSFFFFSLYLVQQTLLWRLKTVS